MGKDSAVVSPSGSNTIVRTKRISNQHGVAPVPGTTRFFLGAQATKHQWECSFVCPQCQGTHGLQVFTAIRSMRGLSKAVRRSSRVPGLIPRRSQGTDEVFERRFRIVEQLDRFLVGFRL